MSVLVDKAVYKPLQPFTTKYSRFAKQTKDECIPAAAPCCSLLPLTPTLCNIGVMHCVVAG